MAKLRTIEIDFDIHRLIELERKGFDEPEYLALRRLLKLPAPETQEEQEASISYSTQEGRSWIGKGVELPHGTEVRMTYGGKTYHGKIDDGEWVVEGVHTRSPSAAAGSAARTKDGKHPALNGWNYWEVKRPNDENFIPLKNLRP